VDQTLAPSEATVMNSPHPVPQLPTDTSVPEMPIPLHDKLMLYLFVVLFFLFGAFLLGDLIAGMFR
jgi:hypothetical protein